SSPETECRVSRSASPRSNLPPARVRPAPGSLDCAATEMAHQKNLSLTGPQAVCRTSQNAPVARLAHDVKCPTLSLAAEPLHHLLVWFEGNTLHGCGLENKPADDNHQQERGRNRSGEQAVLTKLSHHKRLQVDQPQTDDEHRREYRSQQSAGSAITKRCECGQTEDCEIRSRADTCEWKSGDNSVTATEHFRAAGKN